MITEVTCLIEEAKNWMEPAMVANVSKISTAQAILASVSKYGYKEMVPFINERDATSLNALKSTKLSKYFILNTIT